MKARLSIILCLFSFSGFSQWQTIGPTIDGTVWALYNHQDTLFLGGTFTKIGSSSANCSFSAMWTGVNMIPNYNPGITGQGFYCLGGHNNELWAGGHFTNGSIPYDAQMAGKWDGFSWAAPNHRLNDRVNTFTSFNGNLVAGGSFTQINNQTVNHIAIYNNGWQPLGDGFNDDVQALAVYNGELYAAGRFISSGNNLVNRIARWTGTQWVSLSTGFNQEVLAMKVFQNQLIVSGRFTTAGGQNISGIAAWNGQTWNSLGAGIQFNVQGVRALATDGTRLFAGGSFYLAGGSPVQNVAAWDGFDWKSLDQGLAPAVYSLEIMGDYLYAGADIPAKADGHLYRYFLDYTSSGVENNPISAKQWKLINSGNGKLVIQGEYGENVPRQLNIYSIEGRLLYNTTDVFPGKTVSLQSAENNLLLYEFKGLDFVQTGKTVF